MVSGIFSFSAVRRQAGKKVINIINKKNAGVINLFGRLLMIVPL
jgi:hypothetical protein